MNALLEETVDYDASYLDELEAEAIYIFREAAAEFRNPVLLFSGGKDSTVLVRLAEKAFRPAAFPFPVMHVDTGHNFPEVLKFRDEYISGLGEKLIVASIEEAIKEGIVFPEKGETNRNKLQSPVLLNAISTHGFDACFGGGRRDEEKARAKERIFSYRNEFGGWDPKNQRPEPWNLYNTRLASGENMRVFPISNWTEMDVWQYVKKEEIELPPLYFSHEREVFDRNGTLFSVSDYLPVNRGEKIEKKRVRYRTVGCMTISGAVESEAESVDDIIEEIIEAKFSERCTRSDDGSSETSMEDRKREGYF